MGYALRRISSILVEPTLDKEDKILLSFMIAEQAQGRYVTQRQLAKSIRVVSRKSVARRVKNLKRRELLTSEQVRHTQCNRYEILVAQNRGVTPFSDSRGKTTEIVEEKGVTPLTSNRNDFKGLREAPLNRGVTPFSDSRGKTTEIVEEKGVTPLKTEVNDFNDLPETAKSKKQLKSICQSSRGVAYILLLINNNILRDMAGGSPPAHEISSLENLNFLGTKFLFKEIDLSFRDISPTLNNNIKIILEHMRERSAPAAILSLEVLKFLETEFLSSQLLEDLMGQTLSSEQLNSIAERVALALEGPKKKTTVSRPKKKMNRLERFRQKKESDYNVSDLEICFQQEWEKKNFGLHPFKWTGSDRGKMKNLIEEQGIGATLKALKYFVTNWEQLIRRYPLKGVPTVAALYGFRQSVFSEATRGPEKPSLTRSARGPAEWSGKDVKSGDLSF
jgi:hypothetical protein